MKTHSIFFRSSRGASSSEYGIVVGLVGVVAIGTVLTLGNEVSDVFDEGRSSLVENLNASASDGGTDASNIFAYLANGAAIEALPSARNCLSDTALDDTYSDSARGAIDITERCLNMGAGGWDTVYYDGNPDAFQITFDYSPLDGGLFNLGAGNDQVLYRSGDVQIDPSDGDSNILILEGYDSTVLAANGGISIYGKYHVEITDGSNKLRILYSYETPFETISFDDQVFDVAGFQEYVMDAQTSGGDDVIEASHVADTIRPGAGNDEINAYDGDDRIIYDSGNDTVYGSISGGGNDTLDLSKYDRSNVSFATGGNSILITTPDGVITLANQVISGATNRAVDTIEFSNAADSMDHTAIMAAAGA